MITVVDTTGPAITTPGNLSVQGTASGAVVTYTEPTANDAVDGPRPVTCDHHSGETFAAGTTTVHCSASDSRGNTSTASFTVTVTTQADTTPPTIDNLKNVKVNATGPGGATYTFVETGHDPPFPDSSVTISCTFDNGLPPVSGPSPLTVTVTYPLGPNGSGSTTHVRCRATDSSGNKSEVDAFWVKVLGADDQIKTLRRSIEQAMHEESAPSRPGPLKGRLKQQLDTVRDALNQGDPTLAGQQLDQFEVLVDANTPPISPEQNAAWVSDERRIKTVIG